MNRQNLPMYEATFERLALADADNVLDIGCGNGFVVALAAGRCAGSFTGVDRSASAVRAAERRNRNLMRAGRAVFLKADAARLPFADASFSKALTINTVYFWRDLAATLAEVRRVLQAGGVFVNTLYTNEALDQHSHTRFGYQRYAPSTLRAAAEEAGFVAETVPILLGAGYCLACRAA
jgi:ubiquinone/menaquinone biosynthesis C-methylase UbiE